MALTRIRKDPLLDDWRNSIAAGACCPAAILLPRFCSDLRQATCRNSIVCTIVGLPMWLQLFPSDFQFVGHRILTLGLRMRLAAVFILLLSPFVAQADYAIVVSEDTHSDPQWKSVVEALVEKYPQAKVHRYADDVRQTLPALKDQHRERLVSSPRILKPAAHLSLQCTP